MFRTRIGEPRLILVNPLQRNWQSIFAVENRTRTCARSNAQVELKNTGSAMAQYSPVPNSNSLHLALLGGAIAAILATAGCGSRPPPPPASYGADLSGTEMMAARGDPYANRILTPAQRQRVSAYQAGHPGITQTWAQNAVNYGVAGGAGFLAGSTMSAARTGAVTTGATTGEAALVPEAAEVGEAATAAREAAVVGEVGEAAEAGELGELLELLLVF
jgi:hypothetical protein